MSVIAILRQLSAGPVVVFAPKNGQRGGAWQRAMVSMLGKAGRGLCLGRPARLMARSVILKGAAPQHLSDKMSAGNELLR